jgi:hypothetical protein
MPSQFTLPPDTRAIGTGNPPADMNGVVDTLTAQGAYWNALNAAFAGGADPTGAADSTAALQAMLAAAPRGTLCTIPAGTFKISAPLVMSTENVTLAGFGLGSTDKLGSTVLLMSGTFTGNAAISITAPGCQVQNLCIFGNTTTTTSNPVANGLEITGAKFCNIMNLFMQYINGWCIESVGTASVANIGTSIYNITGYNSAGGIHVKGVTGTAFQAQHSLADLQLSQIGVSTGANANLDAIFLEDCCDILTINTNCAVSSSTTGSTLHIKGACTTHMHTNLDIGVFPVAGFTGSTITIEDSANGSPSQIVVTNGVAQSGLVGVTISGGATSIIFTGFVFKNNQTHGAVISGTGFGIDFRDSIFMLNGQGAAGTNYDLNITGTVTQSNVRGCQVRSAVTTIGVAGVQGCVGVTTSGTDMRFSDTQFNGTGTTVGTVFPVNLPSVIRNCRGYSPHGAITVTVPATTVATTALHYDATFYITAGASSCSVVRNTAGAGGGAGPAVVIPAAACVPVFVPALATITATYTNAPTWVVDGM